MRATNFVLASVALTASAAAWVGCGDSNTQFNTTGTGSGGAGGGGGGGTTSSSSSTTSSTSSSSSTTTSSSSSTTSSSSGALPPGIISTSPASIIEAETHVAVGSSGVVAAAWIAIQNGGNSTNGYTFSTNGGSTWTPVAQLASPNGQVASDPVLVFDQQNNCYMTWIGFKTTTQGQAYDMHVYVAKAPAGTTMFGAPIEVSMPASTNDQYDKPWITVTNKNTLILTYAKTSTGGIYSARSADGGLTWTNVKMVEDGNFRNLVYPCAPATGNRIFATYHAGGGIGLRWSDDDGVTWPDANKSAFAAMTEQPAFDDPTCAADGNEVWVTYGLSNDQFGASNSPKLYAIRIAHSSDGGVTVDYRGDAHDTAGGKVFAHPQLVRASNGDLHLVYYAGQADNDAMGSFRRASSTDGGHSFAPSTAIRQPVKYLSDRASPQWLGDYVGVAWSGGDLYTTYVDNLPTYAHVAFAKEAAP